MLSQKKWSYKYLFIKDSCTGDEYTKNRSDLRNSDNLSGCFIVIDIDHSDAYIIIKLSWIFNSLSPRNIAMNFKPINFKIILIAVGRSISWEIALR